MKKGHWISGLALLALVFVASPAYALISVDFVVGQWYNLTSSGVCSGDTTTTGTEKNTAGIIFTGQVGPWNAFNIGFYTYGWAHQSGFLNDGAGNPTTVELAMGSATGLPDPGNWACTPNEAPPDSIKQLRNESAYLYGDMFTGDHYVWSFTGLEPNAAYQLVWFGQGGGTSNVANGVAGVKDSENDWNWDSVTADAAGTILGTFTGWRTPGLYGAQIAAVAPSWPGYLEGDFNLDGEVGPEDFGILKDGFGLDSLPFGNHESWTLGDANDDGEIGPEDFGMLKDNFGLDGGPTGTYPLTNVPEPMSLLTLMGAGAATLLKRRPKA
ncbi:MAG: PEP-CTERM sorting domain-containing protein [Planctomycetota bacterium]|nr:PEP-CTERM sorting domain-containing protein [Planctomycetota bacterium]